MTKAKKDYTMDELMLLIEKNDYLIDTAMDMIELAIENGSYKNEIVDGVVNDKFVYEYLLAEVNNNFIKIFNDIER